MGLCFLKFHIFSRGVNLSTYLTALKISRFWMELVDFKEWVLLSPIPQRTFPSFYHLEMFGSLEVLDKYLSLHPEREVGKYLS